MNLEKAIENKILESNSLDELALILEYLFVFHSVWIDGRLYSIKALVENVKGLKIEIYHNEHPPPHFHVRTNGMNVSFTIKKCELIEGRIGRREHDLIKWWYDRSRSKLIKFWNETRPSDCPVGPILD